MNNALVKRYGNDKRWVNWRIETVGGKPTKVPCTPNGKHAKSTEESTWSKYSDVKHDRQVGIVFSDKRLLGIDLDHFYKDKKISGPHAEMAINLIMEANTYTEVSPSGDGFHLFLELEEPMDLIANSKKFGDNKVEAYTIGRYFTFTGNVYGDHSQLRKVSKEEAISILKIIGYPWGRDKNGAKTENILETSSSNISDQDILTLMFRSANGQKIKQLYEGDISIKDNDHSSADMSLCCHLAFWTGRDANQIERLWLASPLAQRDKTLKRKDYRDRTIQAAIQKCVEVYSGKGILDKEQPLIFLTKTTSKGETTPQNTENIYRILKSHADFMGRFRYDTFKNIAEIKEDGKWRTIEDADIIIVQTQISTLFPQFISVGKLMVADAITKIIADNKFDSAVNFVQSLIWDKQPRLDTWLCSTYGAPNDEYHRAVGSNWLKGLVKRIVEPGSKFDYVLVLEGEQGTKKSTSLFVLGGEWHVETTMSTDSKDFFMQFMGKAIIEFSEGETLSRTEVKRMKAIITTQTDKYRLPYSRFSAEFPRRCVFAMTTNQDEYLKDETGNRRWFPVRLQKEEADIEWLKNNREQLFAEAYHRAIILKETTYEFPREEARRIQEERRIKDPNIDLVSDWYLKKLGDMDRIDGVTSYQVYRDALHGGMASRPMSKYDEMSIADILRTLGLEKRRVMIGGERRWKWFSSKPPEGENVLLGNIFSDELSAN